MKYKKFIKIGLVSCISLLILGIVAITIIVTLVNPNRFKPIIIANVNAATGRQLILSGDISWTIYPNLGLNIKQASLSNPAGFNGTNFIEINSANVAIALMPLLAHKIIFKNLAFDGLKLNLVKQNGTNNWTFNPINKSSVTTNQQSESQGIELEFNSLNLTNTDITYSDMDLKKYHAIKHINLSIDTGFNGGIRLDTKNSLLSLKKVELNYNNDVIGKLNLEVNNLDNPKYIGDLNFSQLRLNNLFATFNLGPQEHLPLLNNLSFTSTINGDSQNINLPKFNFNLSDTINGNANITIQNLANPFFTGNINIANISLNKVLTKLNLAPIDIVNKNLLNQITFKSAFTSNTHNLILHSLVMAIPGSILNGDIEINSFTPLNSTENINIDSLDVADFVPLNGFRAPLNKIHIVANQNFNNISLSNLNGKCNIQIENITLLGLDLVQQIHNINSIISQHNPNANIALQLGTAIEINDKTIAKIRSDLANITSPGTKNLNLKTNLGNFALAAVLHNGIANPSSFKLFGPNLRVNGNGGLNLNRKTLNYKTNTQLLVTGVDPIFTKLIFPANIQGSLANPNASIDWNALIPEIIAYSITKNKGRIKSVISEQIHQAVGSSDKATNKVINDVSNAAANAIGSIFGGGK